MRDPAPALAGRSIDLARLVDLASPDAVVPGRLKLVEWLGNQTLVHLDIGARTFILQAKPPKQAGQNPGSC